jgi:hypothetical protein
MPHAPKEHQQTHYVVKIQVAKIDIFSICIYEYIYTCSLHRSTYVYIYIYIHIIVRIYVYIYIVRNSLILYTYTYTYTYLIPRGSILIIVPVIPDVRDGTAGARVPLLGKLCALIWASLERGFPLHCANALTESDLEDRS